MMQNVNVGWGLSPIFKRNLSILVLIVACLVRLPLSAIEGQSEALSILAPFHGFCPRLAQALSGNNVEELVALTAPMFRVALTNDLNKFKLRFEGLRGTDIFCSVVPRQVLYSKADNDVIESFMEEGIKDIVPIRIVSLSKKQQNVPSVDTIYVNTVLQNSGQPMIIGRFIIGGPVTPDDVNRDIQALRDGCLDVDDSIIFRRDRLFVSDGEYAWNLASKIKDILSDKNQARSLSSRISVNADLRSTVEEIERLSTYRIRAVIPFCSDSQYTRNKVDARDGDVHAYSFAVYAEELPIKEIGFIHVVIGRDLSFRIINVEEYGRFYRMRSCDGG